jgi:hypothetical protein
MSAVEHHVFVETSGTGERLALKFTESDSGSSNSSKFDTNPGIQGRLTQSARNLAAAR